MKRLTFNIRTSDGLIEKTGYAVEYDSHYSTYKFAVHQISNSINSSKRWIVTELSTGLSLGGDNWQRGQTRYKAIREARDMLDIVGFDKFKQRIVEVIDMNAAVISGTAN